VAGLRSTGGAEIPHAGLGKEPLQCNPHVPAQRAVVYGGFAAMRRGSSVLHEMGLVEGDDAIEVRTEPVDDLLESLSLAIEIGAEHCVGREEHAGLGQNRLTSLEAGLMNDGQRDSDGAAIALGIGTKLMGR
jgi:hypothetical protein